MTPDEFARLAALVRDRSGVVLEPDKGYLAEVRLAPLARELGSMSEVVCRACAPGAGPLSTRVVEAMVTTETQFFREPESFESLRAAVLPDLIARRAAERELNVWSAACSTGQEPYSLVMLLRRSFPDLSGWRVNVLATDLSADVLDRARAGRYSQLEANRGLPAALLARHFTQVGADWQLDDAVRGAVEFRQLNLIRPWPALPRMDLIFLRNVMIYFDADTRRALFRRAARLLRPDGYLVLGAAESTLNLDVPFGRADRLRGGFHQLIKGQRP